MSNIKLIYKKLTIMGTLKKKTAEFIIPKTIFQNLRNSIYGGLVEEKIIKESSETFILIEDLIDSAEGLEIDWLEEKN